MCYASPVCSVIWCNRKPKARGLCPACYQRFQRGLDPNLQPRPKADSELSEIDRLRFRGWAVVKRDTPNAEGPCWEWQGNRDEKGYGTLSLPPKRTVFAHRLAYEVWVAFPGNLSVLHHCDNPPCINPNHLWLGTAEDNLRDMATKGRGNTVRLSPEQVLLIRGRKAVRGSWTAWGREFGVSPSAIRLAYKRLTWKNL